MRDHGSHGGVRRCGLVENTYRQLKEKTLSPKVTTTGRGAGKGRGKLKKGSIKHMQGKGGEKQTEKDSG